MTFDQASNWFINGGSIKRKGWSCWINSKKEGFFIFVHDILADDWEIME